MHPSSYKVNSFGINLIAARLRREVVEQQKGKCILVPEIEEFLAYVGSKA